MKTVFGVVLLCICMYLSGCTDCYKGYTEVHNKDGLVILSKDTAAFSDKSTKKLGKTVSIGSTAMLIFVSGEDGKEIDSVEANPLIRNFQNSLSTRDGSTIRYVDFYLPKVAGYLKKIGDTNGSTDGLGVRVFYARDNNRNGKIVFAPIKNTGRKDSLERDIVNPLWITEPERYKALNYGSTCPENCTNYYDLSGMSQRME